MANKLLRKNHSALKAHIGGFVGTRTIFTSSVFSSDKEDDIQPYEKQQLTRDYIQPHEQPP